MRNTRTPTTAETVTKAHGVTERNMGTVRTHGQMVAGTYDGKQHGHGAFTGVSGDTWTDAWFAGKFTGA